MEKIKKKVGEVFALALFIAVIFAVLIWIKPSVIRLFFRPQNLISLVRQASIIAICAVPMTFVLITKGTDLSVGGLISLSGIITAWFYVKGTLVPVCILMGILSGTLMGFLDGVIIAKLNPPPFVSTFVFGELGLGLALLINNGRSIGPLGEDITSVGRAALFGIPVNILLMLLIVIIGSLVLHKTPFGNHVFAFGNNDLVVRQEGINITRITVIIYTFVGFCASVGGILLMTVLKSAHPSQGVPYQLDTIAACALGGVSLTGGEGKIPLAVCGAIFIYAIRNVLNLLGAHPFVQNLVIGLIIIAVVALNTGRRSMTDESAAE